jgi:hypothetical protein
MAYVDRHTVLVDSPPDVVWSGVVSLGGEQRLYAPRPLWVARGLADGLLSGPGWRIEGPGRPLQVGDLMDFWEVVDVRPPTRLRLRAVTRLPGTAYLDVFVHAHSGGSELGLETTFEPAGLAGTGTGGRRWWRTRPRSR